MSMSKEMNFEELMQKLEEITNRLEKDDLNLDESVELFEEGMKLSKENSSAWSGMPQPFTYSAPTEHGNTHGDAVFDVHSDVREAQLLYSFIENEDSWGFICEVNTYYRCYLDWWAWGEGHYPGEPLGAYTVGISNVSRFYYIDSKGKKTVLYQEDTVWNIRTLYKTRYSIVDLYDPQIGTFINRATSNTENIPIQDGYYFKLEYSHKPSWYGSSSELDVAYTVYSPFGEYLYSSGGSDWFFHKWAFTVCKLSGGKYLLGICSPDAISKSEFGGLYICEGGELTRLVDGHCMNYRLRPMKRWRNWWERVQTLD